MAQVLLFFSDRLEKLSIGVLPANQTVEGFFRGDSIPVNKSLARIVNQLHISETLVVEECQKSLHIMERIQY